VRTNETRINEFALAVVLVRSDGCSARQRRGEPYREFGRLPRSFAFERLETPGSCRPVHRTKALRAKIDHVCSVV